MTPPQPSFGSTGANSSRKPDRPGPRSGKNGETERPPCRREQERASGIGGLFRSRTFPGMEGKEQEMSEYRTETLALHAGQEPDADHGRPRGADLSDDVVRFDDTEHAADLSRSGCPATSTANRESDQRPCSSSGSRRSKAASARSPRPPGRQRTPTPAQHHARGREHRLGLDAYGGTYNLFAHTLRSTESRCAGSTPTSPRSWPSWSTTDAPRLRRERSATRS